MKSKISTWVERQLIRCNLPEHIRTWLFQTETRTFEIFNGVMLLLWAFIFIFDSPEFFQNDYRNLDGHLHPVLTGSLILMLSVLTILASLYTSLGWRTFQVYLLFGSCVVWAVILAGLVSVVPPFTFSIWMGFIVYGFLFVISWCGAVHIQDINQKIRADAGKAKANAEI